MTKLTHGIGQFARGAGLLILLAGCTQTRPEGVAGCNPYFYGYDPATHSVGIVNPVANWPALATSESPTNQAGLRHHFVPSAKFAPAKEGLTGPLIQAIRDIGVAAKAGKHPPRLNVLALSGGGEWGAYAAGIVHGWANRDAQPAASGNPGANPAPRLQDIDIVTGISTGAVLSSLVYSASADPTTMLPQRAVQEIASDYTDPNIASLAVERNVLLAAIFHNSLYDDSGLQSKVYDTIRRYIGRLKTMPTTKRLYVGTTNADDSTFYVADLKSIMDDVPDAPQTAAETCLSEAILASSAVPIMFTPRFIGGSMFMDGGTRAGMFSTILLTDPDVAAAIKSAGLTVDVTAIISGDMAGNNYPPPTTPTANSIVKIGLAAEGALVDQMYKDSVYRTEMDLEATFPVFSSRYTYLANATITSASFPACQHLPSQSENLFDPQFMTCIFDIGNAAWSDEPTLWTAGKAVPYVSVPPAAPPSGTNPRM